MKKLLVFLPFLAFAFALPVSAQMPAKSLARIINIKVKPGMAPQFEEGWKKFHQWLHQQDFAVTYYTWNIISGPRTDQYVTGTFSHDWKDFDAVEKLGPTAQKEIQADMGPYVESVEVAYWVYRADLSGHPLDTSHPPPAYSTIVTFFVKPGAEDRVEDVIKTVGAAIEKSHWAAKPSGWYSLVNGGDVPALVLASGHENWADFQPPETSLEKMLTEVYGKDGAEALFKKFTGGLRSERTEIIRYRPDLSFIPASR